MKIPLPPWMLVALLAACTGASGQIQSPAPSLARTISSSQQFYVYSPDREVRSYLAGKAEDIKTETLRRLDADDNWHSPIVIQTLLDSPKPAGVPSVLTSVFIGDANALKLQVNVYDASSLKGRDLDHGILHALLLEMMYRQVALAPGSRFRNPPDWITEGLGEDMRASREGIPAEVYDSMLNSGGPPQLEAFLQVDPAMLDGVSKAVYRAQTMALVRALLGLPRGASSLAAYVRDLPHKDDGLDALVDSFSQLHGSQRLLEKLWTLEIAKASTSSRIEPYSIDQTRQKLAEIFAISADVDPKKPQRGKIIGPAAMQALAKKTDGRYYLEQIAGQLTTLQLRAHPLYVPIVNEYRTIASTLAVKPKKNFEKRITEADKLDTELSKRADDISDYMNWFEAAKLDTPSGTFDDIAEVKAPPRNDAISLYLDSIEARGW